MKFILTILVLLMVFIGYSTSYGQYYYSDNKQVPIGIDSTQLLILFAGGWEYNTTAFASSYQRIDSVMDYETHDEFQIAYLNTSDSLVEFLDTLIADYRVAMSNPYYINSYGAPKLVGKTICCKFNEFTPQTFIDSLNEEYNVEIVYENEYANNQYLLSVGDSAELSTLEIANIYYELTETDFCHPNFKGGYEYNDYEITDYYWEEQWAMHRLFEVSPNSQDSLNHRALEITQGDTNVIIAIIDQGVMPHEDLPSGILVDGYDFADMDNDPTPCGVPGRGWHGQSLAGIISAQHNSDPDSTGNPNTGIYGIAPNCKIMPIKIGTGLEFDCDYIAPPWSTACYENCVGGWFASDERMAAGIEWAWAHGADIISISWGSNEPTDVISFAINQASIVGRDGKGCGVFVSSGNTPNDTSYYPAQLPEVVSVASLHPDDSVWSYCTTVKVDVVAPSGLSTSHSIWTTDLADENDTTGINNIYFDSNCGDPDDDDYQCKFGGTSAAQPVAAGVAALVLSRRPDLTHDQLHDVIRNSADPHLYEEIANPPHQKYGYGMVHPLRALLSVTRGDANNDGNVNVLDITYLLEYLYSNGPAPTPDVLMGDANCGTHTSTPPSVTNLLDVTYLIDYLYNSGPAPVICFGYND